MQPDAAACPCSSLYLNFLSNTDSRNPGLYSVVLWAIYSREILGSQQTNEKNKQKKFWRFERALQLMMCMGNDSCIHCWAIFNKTNHVHVVERKGPSSLAPATSICELMALKFASNTSTHLVLGIIVVKLACFVHILTCTGGTFEGSSFQNSETLS